MLLHWTCITMSRAASFSMQIHWSKSTKHKLPGVVAIKIRISRTPVGRMLGCSSISLCCSVRATKDFKTPDVLLSTGY